MAACPLVNFMVDFSVNDALFGAHLSPLSGQIGPEFPSFLLFFFVSDSHIFCFDPGWIRVGSVFHQSFLPFTAFNFDYVSG